MLIFISEKILDTPLFRPIRFRQKVLTVFAPLELFSLEEKAAFCRVAFSFVPGQQQERTTKVTKDTEATDRICFPDDWEVISC